MRIFIVVAKDRPDLYRYFTAAFAGIETVQVIIDRRLEYDQAPVVSSHQERRALPDIYDELQERGFVIVRTPG